MTVAIIIFALSLTILLLGLFEVKLPFIHRNKKIIPVIAIPKGVTIKIDKGNNIPVL
jgi:hypothetical protein